MKAVKFMLGGALLLSTVGLATIQAGAALRESDGPSTCTGSLTSPGVLAGTYPGNVVVTGYCTVNGGAAVVKGDLRLAPGSALNATYALNDMSGPGQSSLNVTGDIRVESGATLAMGCEPNFSPCSDDPAAGTGGTLTGSNHVGGSLVALNALAVIVHASAIGGDIQQQGGGGGLSCAPPSSGIFSLLQSPVFSDYENNNVNGSLSVLGVQSCYLGVLRNQVRKLQIDSNVMGDSDANEVLTNVVANSISCFNNSPAVQYGDSMGSPNIVGGQAKGECGFKVLQPNPSPGGTPSPISVR